MPHAASMPASILSRVHWPSAWKRRSANGDLDPNVDPDELAWLLLTIVRGIDVIGAAAATPAA